MYGLDGPYLESGPSVFEEIQSQAAHYVEAIRSVQPSGPYLLGGYCIGGNVAHEMARQFEEIGEQVSLVLLFDSFAPDEPSPGWTARGLSSSSRTHLERSRTRLAIARAALPRAHRHFLNLIRLLGTRGGVAEGTEIPMPTAWEALRYVWQDARFHHTLRSGGLDAQELARLDCTVALTPSFWREQRRGKAGLEALRRHAPSMRPVNAPLALFRVDPAGIGPATGRILRLPEKREPLAPAIGTPHADSQLSQGWDRWTHAGLTVCVTSGNHEMMLREPHVEAAAAMAQRVIDEAVP